jgi:hypothetical protein
VPALADSDQIPNELGLSRSGKAIKAQCALIVAVLGHLAPQLGCFNHRLSTFLRPDFGEVFQEGLAEYRAAAERSAMRPHTTIHMLRAISSVSFC